ncbi:MAG: WecB/TagA/CpsF family glycosyltransferase [Clostridia bacterium]|nr:WecB/TagA/CpsF family glycosyltransferase [Clostridia bacterium]
MDKVNILGIKVSKHTIDSAADQIIEYITNGDKRRCVFTPNSEIIMMAYRDKKFAEVLNSADILTADGIGVVYASKMLRNPILERAAGFDTACAVLKKMAPLGKSVYLFGAKPGVAEAAGEEMLRRFPGIKIAGCADGYFDEEKQVNIIADINEKKPDLLFVCLGAPKQEKWISEHRDELDFGVAMGIGGSLDVFAGTVKRAPEFYQKHGIEWLYRLLKQPSRIGRMMDLPKFGFTVLLNGKKFPQE